ncbi:hypothetical protein DAI22_11g051600 [Oryza sativa Japonica Group]|nr:hypothetical protein DAI22_11g051600 [Oryza sativa Japonica Group]
METQSTATPSPGASSATGGGGGGAYPRWVILEQRAVHDDKEDDDGEDDSRCSAADVKINTEAACRSSDGHLVRVYFRRLVAPPAASRRERARCDKPFLCVVAAAGDSLLLQMTYNGQLDRFVYSAADSPTLTLLPTHARRQHWLDVKTTGLLRRRRRDGELVVAELTVKKGDTDDTPEDAELVVLRSGEWTVTRAPIIHDDGKAEEVSRWRTDMVVPVGDTLLCWVDLCRGVILLSASDLFDESRPRRLKYTSLPVEAPAKKFDDDDGGEYAINPRGYPERNRSVCVTGGGAALKFIDVSPRCCCGSPGATTLCHNSSGAFVIKTWTLMMNDDDDTTSTTWAMDAMVNAAELWSLDAYAGPPRLRPVYPIVSMDNPHIICFMVCKEHWESCFHCERTIWKIIFDMKSKKLLSIRYYDESQCQTWGVHYGDDYLPSMISDYFNSNGKYTSHNATTSINDLIVTNYLPQSSHKGLKVVSSEVQVSDEEIFAALEEIPDLGCDDLLKAYSILSHDIGQHRFRSLLGLPMSLRKKWLLIEIKSREASSICSACAANMQHLHA